MRERDSAPEAQGKFNTWDEFDLDRELVNHYKDTHYHQTGERGLAHPSAKKIPVIDSKNGSSESYYYEFRETEYGSYVSVTNTAKPKVHDEASGRTDWSEVDTTAFLGWRYEKEAVKEYVVKFVRKEFTETGEQHEVYLLVNPAKRIREIARKRGVAAKPQETEDAIKRAKGFGPLPVWHPSQDFGDSLWWHQYRAING